MQELRLMRQLRQLRSLLRPLLPLRPAHRTPVSSVRTAQRLPQARLVQRILITIRTAAGP
jgi:hypothetical protein